MRAISRQGPRGADRRSQYCRPAGRVPFESSGEAYLELSSRAEQAAEDPLTALDFKFHFFPWWKAPNTDRSAGVVIAPERRYFEGLEAMHGIKLSPAKQAWYVKKAEVQLADMKREYPSTRMSLRGQRGGRLLWRAHGRR